MCANFLKYISKEINSFGSKGTLKTCFC